MPYAAGCRDCGAPIVDADGEPCDGTRCHTCRVARNRAAAELRTYRRENGLCLTCGAAVARTKLSPVGGDGAGGEHRRVRQAAAYCAKHLAYYAARQRSG